MGHRSSDALAFALRELKLPALAVRASRDEFNDFFSPHNFPVLMLLAELNKVKDSYGVPRLIERVKEGEFDATPDESAEWAETPEGRNVIGQILRGE